MVKGSYKGTNSPVWLNNYLQKQKSTFLDIIGKLAENRQLVGLTNNDLKEHLVGKKQEYDFFSYSEKIIEDLKTAGKIGNANCYQITLNVVKKFHKTSSLPFYQITYAYLEKLETYHFAKGNSINSLSVYMRTIRAIYNRAIKEGVISGDSYPFNNYKVKNTPTSKRAIAFDSIKEIEALEFAKEDNMFHTRNYFLMSFYLMGISFIDLAHLKKTDIIDGRISFSRQKTHKVYEMVVTEKAKKILDYYLSTVTSEYIFPIISKNDPIEVYNQVRDARKRFNKRLKKIATLCGIEKNLTSYVSRHSFATLAKNKGIPITAISEMLGHESLKTTQVYLDSLPSDMIDKYHRDILGE